MRLARLLPSVAIFLSVLGPFALGDVIQRVSVTSSGESATSFYPPELTGVEEGFTAMTPDGRFVVFTSWATDLVPGDNNECRDVFVRDRVTNTTELVSLANTGEQGDWPSAGLDISADGRYVLFCSGATSLVFGDTNGRTDLFVRDRMLGTTERVNVSSSGQQANGFEGGDAAISADARYVAFWDDSTNLVPGDTNGYPDLFVRDRVGATTERVNVSTSGTQANFEVGGAVSISPDGRYVAFSSWGQTLVPGAKWMQVYLRDRTAATTELVSMNMAGGTLVSANSGGPTISADGRYVVFTSWSPDLVPGDTNDWGDVFLRDRLLGTTERLSVTSAGEQGTIPESTGFRWRPAGISADARYVAFESLVMGLVPGGCPHIYNVFIRDRVAGTTEQLVAKMSGIPSHGICPSMTPDGRCIEFESWDPDLVPGKIDTYDDVFVRDLDARFHDVPTCYWAFPHIEACMTAGIVKGYEDNTYRPKYSVTRDQMAVYTSRALAGGDENVPEGPDEASFLDVPSTGYGPDGSEPYWAYKYIEYAVQENVVEGYPDGNYRPGEIVNRGQMAVYIARALVAPAGDDGVPAGPPEATFPDVTPDNEWDWCFAHVEYLVFEGVTQGYPCPDPDSPDEIYYLYQPGLAVGRDQMAVYIARAFDFPV